MARLDRIGAPFGFHDRRVAEEPRDPSPVEGRRHGQDPQVLPQRPLGIEGEGQSEIGVERAFVELVEQDRADAGKLRIVEDHAGEHPLGDDLDPGAGRDLGAEPHPQADRVADPLAEGGRHALGGTAGREAPGFEEDDLLPPDPRFIEEGQRHPRGLAGSRRRHEHGGAARGQGRPQGGEGGFDRECGGRRRHGSGGAAVRARVQPSRYG